MQKFKYTAVNVNKKKFGGVYIAEDVTDLRNQLAKQGLYLLSQKTVKGDRPSLALSLSGKIPANELTTFCRQFAIMIHSGISIVDCIGGLKNQPYSSFFKQSLSIMYDDLNAGMMLSNALKKQKRAYPEFFISMIYIAESSGTLDKVLLNLADYYETDSEIRSKTRSALTYPAVLFVLLVAVIALMMLFVIPTFKTTLTDLDVDMPKITQIVFSVCDAFIANIKIIAIAVVGIILALWIFGKIKPGRYTYDYLKYNLPIIGNVQRNLITSRFARAFGLLLAGGTDMIDALYMIANVLGNRYVEKKFRLAIGDIERGMNISMSLGSYKIFRQMLIQMIAVGENTGELDTVLLGSSKFFDREVEDSLKAMTSLILPILLVVMGLVIGIMFLAVYSPILSIMNTLS